MRSKKWTESKYYGQTAEEIKAGWDKNRDEAAAVQLVVERLQVARLGLGAAVPHRAKRDQHDVAAPGVGIDRVPVVVDEGHAAGKIAVIAGGDGARAGVLRAAVRGSVAVVVFAVKQPVVIVVGAVGALPGFVSLVLSAGTREGEPRTERCDQKKGRDAHGELRGGASVRPAVALRKPRDAARAWLWVCDQPVDMGPSNT